MYLTLRESDWKRLTGAYRGSSSVLTLVRSKKNSLSLRRLRGILKRLVRLIWPSRGDRLRLNLFYLIDEILGVPWLCLIGLHWGRVLVFNWKRLGVALIFVHLFVWIHFARRRTDLILRASKSWHFLFANPKSEWLNLSILNVLIAHLLPIFGPLFSSTFCLSLF